jgi:hypothetical protein
MELDLVLELKSEPELEFLKVVFFGIGIVLIFFKEPKALHKSQELANTGPNSKPGAEPSGCCPARAVH